MAWAAPPSYRPDNVPSILPFAVLDEVKPVKVLLSEETSVNITVSLSFRSLSKMRTLPRSTVILFVFKSASITVILMFLPTVMRLGLTIILPTVATLATLMTDLYG